MDSIILVHGTFAGPVAGVHQWYQPGSDFCRALDAALEQRGIEARCWSDADDAQNYFHWGPGDNTWIARSDAARRLREILRKREGKHHIVAHSHGGNVVLEALGWDSGSAADWFSGTVTLLGTPVLVAARPQRSYVGKLWIALALALPVGIARLPDLRWWHGAALVVALLAFFAVRGWRQLEGIGGFGFRFLEPEPTILLINSAQDEAFRLLSEVSRSLNPLLGAERPSLRERLAQGARECRMIAEATCGVRERRVPRAAVGAVAVMLALLPLALANLVLGRPFAPGLAFWTLVAVLASLAVLSAVPRTAQTLSYVYHVINVWIVFAIKLAKYPFTLWMTALAKRVSWPLLKAYALGLVDSPTPQKRVAVEMQPGAIGKHRFEVLPDDLVTKVVNERDRSIKEEVDRFIDRLSSTDWSVGSVQKCLAGLNAPGLVHSCYYAHLDHGWVVNAIASHIQQHYDEEKKAADEFQRGIDEELGYGRD